MPTKQILHYPNKQLTQKAEKVDKLLTDEARAELAQLIQDLKDTATAYEAQGLAAPQIGVNKQVFVIKNEEMDEYLVCINPGFLPASTQMILSHEGCLSFPGVMAKVARHAQIEARYMNEHGESKAVTLTGVAAVAFQHELDHLAGIVFTDRMSRLQRRMVLKRTTKLRKKHTREIKRLKEMLKDVRIEQSPVSQKTELEG